jgi:Ca2+-binding RTX toxin-like protein
LAGKGREALMRVNRTTVVLAGALLVLGLALVGAPPAGAVTYCGGEPLTQSPGLLVGTAGDDVMAGTPGDDAIYGLGGNDTICGGGGDDRIFGGPGMDHLLGEGGRDRLYGQSGCDWLVGGDGNDVLLPGGGGAHCSGTVEGGSGGDRIVVAQEGDNDVFGGTERDTVDFRKAPQGMFVDLASGQFWSLCSPPIGSLVFETENVFGSGWADEIYGNGRPNRLYGFDGNDAVHGRGGNDFLDGGAGIGDLLYGDAGSDTCVNGETSICEG